MPCLLQTFIHHLILHASPFYIPSLLSHSHIPPLLIFDCSVTTCLHFPETLGQGAFKMQPVKIHPALRSGSESTCHSLMPAVRSHYLIGIEMHLACVFCLHCTPAGDTVATQPLPRPLLTLIHTVPLGEAFSPLMCGQTVYMDKKEKREMAPNRSQPNAGRQVLRFSTVNKSTV